MRSSFFWLCMSLSMGSQSSTSGVKGLTFHDIFLCVCAFLVFSMSTVDECAAFHGIVITLLFHSVAASVCRDLRVHAPTARTRNIPWCGFGCFDLNCLWQLSNASHSTAFVHTGLYAYVCIQMMSTWKFSLMPVHGPNCKLSLIPGSCV